MNKFGRTGRLKPWLKLNGNTCVQCGAKFLILIMIDARKSIANPGYCLPLNDLRSSMMFLFTNERFIVDRVW